MTTSKRMWQRTTPMPRGKGLTRTPMARGSKPLPFRSKKREREQRERRRMVDAMEADGPVRCFVTDCTRPADDLHELLSRGRGGSPVDPANTRPVCRTHHMQITTEPAWAEANGYALPSPPRTSYGEAKP